MNAIEAEAPAGMMIHVILDNCGSHKHPKVKVWLPTSVLRVPLYADLGLVAQCRRGLLRSAPNAASSAASSTGSSDLQATIKRFLAETNDNSRPFVWTANPDNIIAAVRRGHQVLGAIS